jgi:sterol desaturase/sphingolipid hydroxylase (fatty acid hydroxylase superfamily)
MVLSLLKSEYSRLSKKGASLILSSMSILFFIFILPRLLYPIYLLLPHQNMHIMRSLIVPVLHNFLLILFNCFLSILYTQKIPYFEQYRVSKSTPWPWEKDPVQYHSNRPKIYLTLFINNFIIFPLLIVHSIEVNSSPMTTDPEKFPSGLEILVQLIFFMVVEDFSFYWMHRLVHTSYLYSKIHKQHHEFKTTVGISATYAHFLEFIFVDAIPSGLGCALLGDRTHVFTYYMWVIVRIIETTDGHCGYDFPWSPFRLIFLGGSSSHHDFHHSHIVGNYSSFFTTWDRICGTDLAYKKYSEKIKSN